MKWPRYVGQAFLAMGVIAVGIWATANELLDIPPYQFWTGILCYLIAAEVVWTLIVHRLEEQEQILPRQGLLSCSLRMRVSSERPHWLWEGGRVRWGDIRAQRDSPREALPVALHHVLLPPEGSQLHILEAPPGMGRSTFLLRLAAALLEAKQTVYLVLSTPQGRAWEHLFNTARRRPVYVLIDDLDMCPEAECWLYEVQRRNLPLIFVATLAPFEASFLATQEFFVLPPAFLHRQGNRRELQFTQTDGQILARDILGSPQAARVNLQAISGENVFQAARHLHALARGENSLPDAAGIFTEAEGLFPSQTLMQIALAGAAELAIPPDVWEKWLGPKSEAQWRQAGLALKEFGWLLLPHRLACLMYLERLGFDNPLLLEALLSLCQALLDEAPAFVGRLLFGLLQQQALRPLAQTALQRLPITELWAAWPEETKRLWRPVWAYAGLMCPEEKPSDYPPDEHWAAIGALLRKDYALALQIATKLRQNPLYEAVARFNAALALFSLGRYADAQQELAQLPRHVFGAHFLRGRAAEERGDILKALEHYEASRKADELPLASLRRLAFGQIKAGAPRAAIPLFESLLGHEPNDVELYAGLAVAYFQAGMAQRAAAQSARAIQAGIDPAIARKAVARAYMKIYAFSPAMAELEACLAYDEKDLEAWRELAQAAQGLGRFQREEECWRYVLSQQPHDRQARTHLARCLRDQGLFSEAKQILEPLWEEAVSENEALLLGAELAAAQADRPQQEALAAQALGLDDTNGWAHFWLAHSQSELNEIAQKAYQKAVYYFQMELQEGLPPRQAATLWQAIYLAAQALGDAVLAAEAQRKALQEAEICETLGEPIHSLRQYRAVPVSVFRESFLAS